MGHLAGWMQSYLDFEKPVAEIEAKIRENSNVLADSMPSARGEDD